MVVEGSASGGLNEGAVVVGLAWWIEAQTGSFQTIHSRRVLEDVQSFQVHGVDALEQGAPEFVLLNTRGEIVRVEERKDLSSVETNCND